MKKLMSKLFTRGALAHVLMTSCVILIGLGISIINLGLGFASAGLVCGLYGYLLGAE